MASRFRRFAPAVAFGTLVMTGTPATAALATPPPHVIPPSVVTKQKLAEKLAEALHHDGAKHLHYAIDDPSFGTYSRGATTESAPASNEKIFTVATLLHQVGAGFRYDTPVAGTTRLVGHTLHGDLVVTGSGDPTLTRLNLLDMAKAVHQKGVHHVTGHLIVDDKRYSKKTIVAGWKHKFVPVETGTMDAFSVDQNEWHGGKSYRRDPTLDNARYFRHMLKKRHISVGKKIEIRHAPPTVRPLVQHRSKTLGAIVASTLTDSINFDAEMMFREAGAQLTGHGSPKTGREAEQRVAGDLHVPVGIVHDGSGLSYTDRSSPAVLMAWLRSLKTQPYYSTVYDGMPVSCRTGTLEYRMCGPNLAGIVHAKTGTLNHVSTLSGYVTTTAGHPITFSFLASGVKSYSKLYAAVGAAIAVFRTKG